MDYIKPIQYRNNGFEPDDWQGLQALIDAAADEKERAGDIDFDPFKSKSRHKTSNDALLGNKINMVQRGRGRGRRNFRIGYRNQGNRNQFNNFGKYNNQNDKRGNKYDNKRNVANRSGRGRSKSQYRQRSNRPTRTRTRTVHKVEHQEVEKQQPNQEDVDVVVVEDKEPLKLEI